jgi:hypothetical protein
MKRIIRAIFPILLFSPYTLASESPCSFDDTEVVSVEYIDTQNNSSTIGLTYPLIEKAELTGLRLSYGFGSGYKEELSVGMETKKSKEGYYAYLTVFGDHKPVFIRAMYKFKNCYASIEVRIEKQTVWQEPNS